MQTRTATNQSLHDTIIDEASGLLKAEARFDVYTNPGQEHVTSIGGLYPDIILTDKGSTTARFVIEVETAESVSDEEAAQWRQYANLGATFYLLVPAVLLPFAKQVCQRNGVRASFAYFYREQNGRLQVVYEGS